MCVWSFWGNLRDRDHLEDPRVSGSIILKWVFRRSNGSMNWIDLAQYRNRSQALLNTVINIRFP